MNHLYNNKDCPLHHTAYYFCKSLRQQSIQSKKNNKICSEIIEVNSTRNAEKISNIKNHENEICRQVINNNHTLISTGNDSKENPQTQISTLTYTTKYDVWDKFNKTMKNQNSTEILNSIHHGEYIILFEKGSQEEKWKLEILSCNLNHWKPTFLPIELLPSFYSSQHLNRIIQTTQNNVKKVEIDNDGSDYSRDYDSEESDKEFDKDECEEYDIENDTMNANRPQNYSYYLKSINWERNHRENVRLRAISRKKYFITCLKYHRYFIKIACCQKIDTVNDKWDGYTCPW